MKGDAFMEKIKYQDFMQYLLSYNRAIPGEMLTENFISFEDEYMSDKSWSDFFYAKGCVCSYAVYKESDLTRIFCYIFQISDDYDLESVAAECKAKISEDRQRYANVHPMLFAGNSQLKKLTRDNAAEIKDMCAPFRNNDTRFGKILAGNFYNYDWNGNLTLPGYCHDEKLVGVVSCRFCEKADLAFLCDAFVVPEYRSKGIGKILIQEALSEYPDKQ